MIGHTKGEHDMAHFRDEISRLRGDGRLEFVTLSEMVDVADRDLVTRSRGDAVAEARFQVAREYTTVMGDERNVAQARRLQSLIPLDRSFVLDLGCGAGDWSHAIAEAFPWMRVVGVDAGAEFIARARERWATDRVEFLTGDFRELPLADSSVDCVYADNVLEHAFDLEATMGEIRRVLKPEGFLVAAIPADGLNPRRCVDNHNWKATTADIRMRFECAGFTIVRLGEVDLLRDLRSKPYPPALDRMIHVVGRVRVDTSSALGQVSRLVEWVYGHLDPARTHSGESAAEILRNGYAWCWGYARVLQDLLSQHGYPADIVSMTATDHERGRGTERVETHEAVLADVGGRQVVLDAMANTVIPHSLLNVLADPHLAIAKNHADDRYLTRRYHLYDTGYWYSRVVKYTVRGRTVRNKHRRPLP
jgi:ubiquinone/menaquinone biosynthesis C-methylase UbiE